MKYRSRTDIIVQMLTTAKQIEGVPKTRIMYEAYLSYMQLKEYLSLLLDSNMLELTQENKYRTTEKGLKMIEAYEKAAQLLDSSPPSHS